MTLEGVVMSRVLKQGNEGPDVVELQELLIKRGHPVEVSGVFGADTYEAVKAFQSNNRDEEGKPLQVDGEVGDHTLWSLRQTVVSDSSHATLSGRCMYVWKLKPILILEGGIDGFVQKVKKAKLSSVWIKIGDGASRFSNISGEMEELFTNLHTRLADEGISVWGWHVPSGRNDEDATAEAELVGKIAEEYSLDGILMDAEKGGLYFKGDAQAADTYATRLRGTLVAQGKGLAISSHDIPSNFPDFPFDSFARHATVNAPQVYYGGSQSVENRLNRAIKANSHLGIPFVPVGAGWVGGAGGCGSGPMCGEWAITFMRLVREHGFPGYSFWHWEGAPPELWEVLFADPV
jgi:hypothetical protein